jgi:hypothetical protein
MCGWFLGERGPPVAPTALVTRPLLQPPYSDFASEKRQRKIIDKLSVEEQRRVFALGHLIENAIRAPDFVRYELDRLASDLDRDELPYFDRFFFPNGNSQRGAIRHLAAEILDATLWFYGHPHRKPPCTLMWVLFGVEIDRTVIDALLETDRFRIHRCA